MTIKPIQPDNQDGEIKRNLEKYCNLAKDLGADDAKVITTNQIPVDIRVNLKCRIPVCFNYGQSVNCPPHCITAEETRIYLKKYKFAVIFKIKIPPEVIVREKKTMKDGVNVYKQTFEIVNKIESAAFYDGHYFATGLGAGNCKDIYCWSEEKCAVLIGNKCRASLKARPSMEAVGIDCFKLASTIGWPIIPIGSDAKKEEVSHGTLMGLILIN
ncbi:MAG: DUF2284 domain-containing protein [Promethearchaeota archaeon]